MMERRNLEEAENSLQWLVVKAGESWQLLAEKAGGCCHLIVGRLILLWVDSVVVNKRFKYSLYIYNSSLLINWYYIYFLLICLSMYYLIILMKDIQRYLDRHMIVLHFNWLFMSVFYEKFLSKFYHTGWSYTSYTNTKDLWGEHLLKLLKITFCLVIFC